ncbi:POP1, partial [Symbiodinium necroappetens]
MVRVKCHEELLQEGALVQFSRDKGNALFVSHEWVSTDHPDPKGEQLKVLQGALMRMLGETDIIPVTVSAELMYGLQNGLLMTEMRARPLFVWYDFFSCPQRMHGPIGTRFTHPSEQELAIHSIPAYIEMCRCVVILCPPILH